MWLAKNDTFNKHINQDLKASLYTFVFFNSTNHLATGIRGYAVALSTIGGELPSACDFRTIWLPYWVKELTKPILQQPVGALLAPQHTNIDLCCFKITKNLRQAMFVEPTLLCSLAASWVLLTSPGIFFHYDPFKGRHAAFSVTFW